MTILTPEPTATDPTAAGPARHVVVRPRPVPVAVAFDLYRDIHKGIRTELFAVVTTAARLDPADTTGVAALGAQVQDVIDMLDDHAHHEDLHIHPVLARHRPELAFGLARQHAVLEERTKELADAAQALGDAGDDGRLAVHRAHLALAAFTGDYLLHQHEEETVAMPALADAVPVEELLAINGAIVSSIPPERMSASLAFMLPAMNVLDRTEMLGGMRASAPEDVFAGVWSLTRSVLDPSDADALGTRLGIA